MKTSSYENNISNMYTRFHLKLRANSSYLEPDRVIYIGCTNVQYRQTKLYNVGDNITHSLIVLIPPPMFIFNSCM